MILYCHRAADIAALPVATGRTFRLLRHCVIVGGLFTLGAKMVIAAQRSLVSCTAVSYVVKHFCFISF